MKTPSDGETWNELAYVCDTFGPRMSGSKSLELAIDHMKSRMEQGSKLDSVSKEPAMIPNWQVLSQSCEITAPVAHPMSILTLGYSVSTAGPLEAEVVLVHDFDELDTLGAAQKLSGKIVVFNYKFINYPKSVKYRTQGALQAMKYGAAAALVRSVTSFSIYSPHAGVGSKSIPTAAITVEDANLIERWVKRNRTVTIRLQIKTDQSADVQSYNLVGRSQGYDASKRGGVCKRPFGLVVQHVRRHGRRRRHDHFVPGTRRTEQAESTGQSYDACNPVDCRGARLGGRPAVF